MSYSDTPIEQLLSSVKQESAAIDRKLAQLESLLSLMPTNRMLFSDLQNAVSKKRDQFLTSHSSANKVALQQKLFEQIETLEKDLSMIDLSLHFFNKSNTVSAIEKEAYLQTEDGKSINAINHILLEKNLSSWTERGIFGSLMLLKNEDESLFPNYFLNYNLMYLYPKSAFVFFADQGFQSVQTMHTFIDEVISFLWQSLEKYLKSVEMSNLQKINLQRLFAIGYAIPFESNNSQTEFHALPREISQDLWTKGSAIIDTTDSALSTTIENLCKLNLAFTLNDKDHTYLLLNLKLSNSELYKLQDPSAKTPSSQPQFTRKENISKIAGKAYFG